MSSKDKGRGRSCPYFLTLIRSFPLLVQSVFYLPIHSSSFLKNPISLCYITIYWHFDISNVALDYSNNTLHYKVVNIIAMRAKNKTKSTLPLHLEVQQGNVKSFMKRGDREIKKVVSPFRKGGRISCLKTTILDRGHSPT